MQKFNLGLLFSGFLIVTQAFTLSQGQAADAIPACYDNNHNVLPIDNQAVLTFKKTTPNATTERAHIQGKTTRSYPDRNGHAHFEIQIGPNATDTIEVIYQLDMGKLPPFNVGQVIETCGDYITSTAQTGAYPPSPDGAIIHWVHMSDNPSHHPSGYVDVDGVLCGTNPGAGAGHNSGHGGGNNHGNGGGNNGGGNNGVGEVTVGSNGGVTVAGDVNNSGGPRRHHGHH